MLIASKLGSPSGSGQLAQQGQKLGLLGQLSGANAASCERWAHATVRSIRAIPASVGASTAVRRSIGSWVRRSSPRAVRRRTTPWTVAGSMAVSRPSRFWVTRPSSTALNRAANWVGVRPWWPASSRNKRDVPLMRAAQQEPDMVFDQEPAAGRDLAIG